MPASPMPGVGSARAIEGRRCDIGPPRAKNNYTPLAAALVKGLRPKPIAWLGNAARIAGFFGLVSGFLLISGLGQKV